MASEHTASNVVLPAANFHNASPRRSSILLSVWTQTTTVSLDQRAAVDQQGGSLAGNDSLPASSTTSTVVRSPFPFAAGTA